jgi:saccharopine dehydrogenase-like NADP-dependent oxidoreductase
MANRVLIIGGRGRIGSSVADDLLEHTNAEIVVTGTRPFPNSPDTHDSNPRKLYQQLTLDNAEVLNEAIAAADLVVHCAGPFRYRDGSVLKTCIAHGVPYLDVSDDRSFTRRALALNEQANAAGVTAIINTGVFPGISNSMVRQAVEQLDTADEIHLSYVVAGSGGAGVTVMRTTFLGLQNPFEVWVNGQWKTVKPYTGRETINFPAPIGRTGVYWFDMPEAFTLAETFPVKTVAVKFGSTPDFYNVLTGMVAGLAPASLMRQEKFIEFFSHVSYKMTAVTNRWSGIGIGMNAKVVGVKDGHPATYSSLFVHDSTAKAIGSGTGSLAEQVLDGKIQKPGVWPVEQALSTPLFEEAMQSRGIKIQQGWT